MTRRNATLTALALTAALSAPALASDPGAPAINARPEVSAIAPGGNITSVVQATARYGWPHSPRVNEMYDVANLVLALKVPRSGSVRCVFGLMMGRSTCTTKIGKTRRAYSVRVWEDGSYTITRKAVR